MFGFFSRSRRTRHIAGAVCCDYDAEVVRLGLAARHFEILEDSIGLIKSTVNPGTFFSRYRLAVEKASELTKLCRGYESADDAAGMLDVLLDEKENIFDSFFLRCHEAGRLVSAKDEILSHMEDIPQDSIDYFWELYWDEFYNKA